MQLYHNGKLQGVEDKILVAHVLDTLALSKTPGDGKTYTHDVVLRLNVMRYEDGTEDRPHWVLQINGTPASWYVSTLLEGVPKRGWPRTILLDAGQGWECINFGDVLAEAIKKL